MHVLLIRTLKIPTVVMYIQRSKHSVGKQNSTSIVREIINIYYLKYRRVSHILGREAFQLYLQPWRDNDSTSPHWKTT